jgi:hypothetical protein
MNGSGFVARANDIDLFDGKRAKYIIGLIRAKAENAADAELPKNAREIGSTRSGKVHGITSLCGWRAGAASAVTF